MYMQYWVSLDNHFFIFFNVIFLLLFRAVLIIVIKCIHVYVCMLSLCMCRHCPS